MTPKATDNAPDTLATPEGDNEERPDQPLSGDEAEPLRPGGDEPHSKLPYRKAEP